MGEEGDDEKSIVRSLLERLEEGSDPSPGGQSPVTPYVVNGIAIIVTLVWAGSFVADVMISNYNPPPQIHMVMLGIVGSIFGFQVVHRTRNGSS